MIHDVCGGHQTVDVPTQLLWKEEIPSAAGLVSAEDLDSCRAGSDRFFVFFSHKHIELCV